MISDVRVCFVGDSFVAGVGDPEHLGWVGRLAARSEATGRPLTAYNLGVRRQTSREVLDRWAAECAQRLPKEADSRVVLSFGVNDTTEEDGEPRVVPARSTAHLGAVLDGAAAAGWPVLVIGPPPVADVAQNERSALLDRAFAEVCADRNVSYVPVLEPLLNGRTWLAEAAAGDGAHPGAGGYADLADLVWPVWADWLAGRSVASAPACRGPRH